MDLLLVYSLTLFVAVLISGIASRSVLSTVVLFLLVGFVIRWAGWVNVVGLSILLHWSTDVLVASYFDRSERYKIRS